MTSDEGPRPPPVYQGIRGIDLEDLFDELRARASVAQRSQARMSDLLDAVVAIGTDLDLADVLERIVASAMSLVDARYGALGVVSPDGEHLVEFVTRGVTDEQRGRIGDLPRGHGILGLLIRDPRPRRLADLSAHPDSFGFPPHHPPMTSFLGAPIRIRDEVFGNLYMADKVGAPEFTAEDESVLVALAAAAGVAIDNARLFDLGRRQQQWIEAVGEVAQLLLEREDEEAATSLVAAHARRLSGGRRTLLALSDGDAELVVRAVSGGDEAAYGRTVLAGAHWERARRVRAPLLMLPDAGSPDDRAVRADVCRVVADAIDGPLAVLPLSPRRGDLGVLVVSWDVLEEGMPRETLPALTEFAQQAGLALLAGRAHRDRARMTLVDDRDRIARDMHDHVIQRLFATGLSLQAASRMAEHPVVRTRLEEAVDDLDAAVKEIRHAIFELHQPVVARSADEELVALVGSFGDGLGFEPDVELVGSVGKLSASLRSDVLAVVREGLSNVARHAGASAVRVAVTVTHEVVVVVADDGSGVEPGQAVSGLVNLRERAVSASGSFDIAPGEPSGTVLTWRVPTVPGSTA